MIQALGVGAFAQSVMERNLVKEAEVRKVVTEYLEQKSGDLGLEISVKNLVYSGDLALPPGKVSFELVAPDHWEGWGSANLALIVRVNDKVERNIAVKVQVEALADMVVTVRPLERGHVLGREDIAMAKRDLAKIHGKICRGIDEVVGKRLRNSTRGNAPLLVESLERVPIIKSGQLVTILMENDIMRITTSGKARNSGAAGDAITVQNLTSLKEISARIIDASTVRVDF
jgi:flagella basal body P-ring formation protein FlgA